MALLAEHGEGDRTVYKSRELTTQKVLPPMRHAQHESRAFLFVDSPTTLRVIQNLAVMSDDSRPIVVSARVPLQLHENASNSHVASIGEHPVLRFGISEVGKCHEFFTAEQLFDGLECSFLLFAPLPFDSLFEQIVERHRHRA